MNHLQRILFGFVHAKKQETEEEILRIQYITGDGEESCSDKILLLIYPVSVNPRAMRGKFIIDHVPLFYALNAKLIL